MSAFRSIENETQKEQRVLVLVIAMFSPTVFRVFPKVCMCTNEIGGYHSKTKEKKKKKRMAKPIQSHSVKCVLSRQANGYTTLIVRGICKRPLSFTNSTCVLLYTKLRNRNECVCVCARSFLPLSTLLLILFSRFVISYHVL